jgi:nitric oxide reductase activation protein
MALLTPLRVTLRGLNEGAEINLDRFVRFHSERRRGGAEGNRGFYEPE